MGDHHFGYIPKLSTPPKCVFFQCENVIANFKCVFFSVKMCYFFSKKQLKGKNQRKNLLCEEKNHVAASAHVGQLIN
jgi:hypothetical protein